MAIKRFVKNENLGPMNSVKPQPRKLKPNADHLDDFATRVKQPLLEPADSQEGFKIEDGEDNPSKAINLVEPNQIEFHQGLNEKVDAEEEVSKLELNSFSPIKPKGPTRGRRSDNKGSISIVYGEYGNRLVIHKALINYLHLTNNKIQIGVNQTRLILGTNLGEGFEYYSLKPDKSKFVTYSKPLVSELVDQFNLDYTDITSRTFKSIRYTTKNGSPVVVVDMVEDRS